MDLTKYYIYHQDKQPFIGTVNYITFLKFLDNTQKKVQFRKNKEQKFKYLLRSMVIKFPDKSYQDLYLMIKKNMGIYHNDFEDQFIIDNLIDAQKNIEKYKKLGNVYKIYTHYEWLDDKLKTDFKDISDIIKLKRTIVLNNNKTIKHNSLKQQIRDIIEVNISFVNKRDLETILLKNENFGRDKIKSVMKEYEGRYIIRSKMYCQIDELFKMLFNQEHLIKEKLTNKYILNLFNKYVEKNNNFKIIKKITLYNYLNDNNDIINKIERFNKINNF